MERLIMEDLIRWKDKPDRKPLIVEGVRQCGKTYILKEFGRRFFKNTAYLNFQDSESAKGLFEGDLDVRMLMDSIGAFTYTSMVPGSTLLILDEIQECPRALTSLKYFKENASDFHVVCAGSLLGVMLAKGGSFPVGGVDRLAMYPMNFREFLMSAGEGALLSVISRLGRTDEVPAPLHSRMVQYLREYMVVGGMPDVVSAWNRSHDIKVVSKKQRDLLADYKDDFEKHAEDDLDRIIQLWDSIPLQLARENGNRKFKWADIGRKPLPEVEGGESESTEERTGSREYRKPLEWLQNAGLIHVVKLVKRPDVPLKSQLDERSFKVYMMDVGLLRAHAGYPPKFAYDPDPKYGLFKGAMTENLVLCEMMSAGIQDMGYWKDGRNEVDFIVNIEGSNYPVEVKAETKTSTVSLDEYSRKYHPERSFIISMNPLRVSHERWYVPLYDVGSMLRSLEPEQPTVEQPTLPQNRAVMFDEGGWTNSDGGFVMMIPYAMLPVSVLRRNGDSFVPVDVETMQVDTGVEIRSGERFGGMVMWTPAGAQAP